MIQHCIFAVESFIKSNLVISVNKLFRPKTVGINGIETMPSRSTTYNLKMYPVF